MMMQCVMLSNYPVARALCLEYDFDNVDGSYDDVDDDKDDAVCYAF